MTINAQTVAEEARIARSNLEWLCRHKTAEMVSRTTWRAWPEKEARILVNQMPSLLKQTEIVVWNGDLYTLAVSGASEFRGTTIPQLGPEDATPQFWHFNRFTVGEADGGADSLEVPKRVEMAGMVTFVLDNMLNGIAVFAGPRSNPEDLYLRLVAPLVPGDKAVMGQAMLMACRAFMRIKLAALEPITLPRGERRRLKREGLPIPEIRIVQLRQREESGNKQNGNREYHHKWIVQGHWRRLHEPRKADGAEVTFVHAYVKGPEDAPLLQPRESVYVVAR